MFGKARDHSTALLDSASLEGIFGDEDAAARAAGVDALRDRVDHVESQIASQFTSLATYAQIAQEQVELARAEARTATERSEQRITSLIERERADRLIAQGDAPSGSTPDLAARLDAVEHLVAKVQQGLDECREQQLALANAITAMFDRLAPAEPTADPAPAPATEPAATPAAFAPLPLFEPIDELTLA